MTYITIKCRSFAWCKTHIRAVNSCYCFVVCKTLHTRCQRILVFEKLIINAALTKKLYYFLFRRKKRWVCRECDVYDLSEHSNEALYYCPSRFLIHKTEKKLNGNEICYNNLQHTLNEMNSDENLQHLALM